jgi:hypothetical protein
MASDRLDCHPPVRVVLFGCALLCALAWGLIGWAGWIAIMLIAGD